MPPSTYRIWPFTKLDASEARKTTAPTAPRIAQRPAGVRAFSQASRPRRRAARGSAPVHEVARPDHVGPGPVRRELRAHAARQHHAGRPFAVEYAAIVGRAMRLWTEPTFTIFRRPAAPSARATRGRRRTGRSGRPRAPHARPRAGNSVERRAVLDAGFETRTASGPTSRSIRATVSSTACSSLTSNGASWTATPSAASVAASRPRPLACGRSRRRRRRRARARAPARPEAASRARHERDAAVRSKRPEAATEAAFSLAMSFPPRPLPAGNVRPRSPRAATARLRPRRLPALPRRQRLRLDGRRGRVLRRARRLRRGRRQLRRHRRRLPGWAAGNEGGESETIIGRWLAAPRQPRPASSIATKVGQARRRCRASRRGRSARAAEDSLRRLGTDRIDLYYAHDDDPETPARGDARARSTSSSRRARCAHIAASNFAAPRLAEALAIGRERRPRRATSRCSRTTTCLHRDDLRGRARRRSCTREGLGCRALLRARRAASSPASTGPAAPAGHAPRRRRGEYLDARGRAVLAALDARRRARTARRSRRSRSPGCAAQPTVVAPIASARTPAQLAELLPMADLVLDAGELAALDEASRAAAEAVLTARGCALHTASASCHANQRVRPRSLGRERPRDRPGHVGDQGARRRAGRRRARRGARSAVRPAYGAGGARRAGPEALCDSVVDAGPGGAARGRRAGRRRRAREPGRDGARLGPRHRPAALAGDLVAGSPRGRRLRAARAAHARPPRASSPACRSIRTSPRRRCAWLREHGTRDGVVHDDRRVARARALTGAFVTDAATASRTLLLDLDRVAWSPEALRAVRARRDERPAARSSAARSSVGETRGVRRRAAAHRPRRRPAGGALRARAASSAGDARSARTARARSCSRTPARAPRRSRDGPGRLRRVAARRRARPTASTARSTRPARRSRWLARPRPRRAAAATSTRSAARVADAGGVAVRAGARRPRRAVLAAGGARRARRPRRSRPTRAHLVRAVLEGIAAQVAVLAARHGGRPRRAARAPARRRRPHALARPHAGAGRPAAAAGRGLPVARRDGARRRRRSPASARRRPRRSPARSPGRGAPAARLRAAHRRRGRGAPRALAPRRAAASTARRVVSSTSRYDVAVIGAGVVGAAIARELARYRLRVVAPRGRRRRRHGHDARRTRRSCTPASTPSPGRSRRASCARGYALLARLRRRGRHPGRAHRRAARRLGRRAARRAAGARREGRARTATRRPGSSTPTSCTRREPHLGPGALGALEVPDESIICPFTTPLAFATEAVRDGVELRLGRPRRRRSPDGRRRRTRSQTPRGTVRGPLRRQRRRPPQPTTIDRMLRPRRASPSRPRRGELIVFDKLARPLVGHILLPVPTATRKGVLVAPTVFGNVCSARRPRTSTTSTRPASTAAGLARLREQGRAHPARRSRRGGDRGLRRPPRGDRARRLPDPLPPRAALRLRRRHPLDRAHASMAIAEHVRDGLARRRARARRRTATFAPSAHAEHRRGASAAVPARRADRGRSRVRPHRLPLRARHARRDPRRRCARRSRRARSTGCAAARARSLGRCQGFYCGADVSRACLRRATSAVERAAARASARDGRRRSSSAAARPGSPPRSSSRRLGVGARRRARARARGRRHPAPLRTTPASACATCTASLSGPAYARALRRRSPRAAGVDDPHGDDRHRLGRADARSTPTQPARPRARSHARRRRSSPPAAASGRARRGSSPGDRPPGVLTTGALQQLVYLHDARRRARAPSSSAPST